MGKSKTKLYKRYSFFIRINLKPNIKRQNMTLKSSFLPAGPLVIDFIVKYLFKDNDLLNIPHSYRTDEPVNFAKILAKDVLTKVLPKNRTILQSIFTKPKEILIDKFQQFDVAMKLGREMNNQQNYSNYLKVKWIEQQKHDLKQDELLSKKEARFHKFTHKRSNQLKKFTDYLGIKFMNGFQKKRSKSVEVNPQKICILQSRFVAFMQIQEKSKKENIKSRKRRFTRRNKNRLQRYGNLSFVIKREKNQTYQNLINTEYGIPRSLKKFIRIQRRYKDQFKQRQEEQQHLLIKMQDKMTKKLNLFKIGKQYLAKEFNGSLFNRTIDFTNKVPNLYYKLESQDCLLTVNTQRTGENIQIFYQRNKQITSLKNIPPLGRQERRKSTVMITSQQWKQPEKTAIIKESQMCDCPKQSVLDIADEQKKKSCTNESFGGLCQKLDTTVDIIHKGFPIQDLIQKMEQQEFITRVARAKKVTRMYFRKRDRRCTVSYGQLPRFGKTQKDKQKAKNEKINDLRTSKNQKNRFMKTHGKPNRMGSCYLHSSKPFQSLLPYSIQEKVSYKGSKQMKTCKDLRLQTSLEQQKNKESPDIFSQEQENQQKRQKRKKQCTKKQYRQLPALKKDQNIKIKQAKLRIHQATIKKYRQQQLHRKPTKHIYKKYLCSKKLAKIFKQHQKKCYRTTLGKTRTKQKMHFRRYDQTLSTHKSYIDKKLKNLNKQIKLNRFNKTLNTKESSLLDSSTQRYSTQSFIDHYHQESQCEQTRNDYSIPVPTYFDEGYLTQMKFKNQMYQSKSCHFTRIQEESKQMKKLRKILPQVAIQHNVGPYYQFQQKKEAKDNEEDMTATQLRFHKVKKLQRNVKIIEDNILQKDIHKRSMSLNKLRVTPDEWFDKGN